MHHHGHTHHHHHHGHHHGHGQDASSNIGLALVLNFTFAILEVIGGIWTGSVAILADAMHDFGDSLSLGLAYIFEKLAKKRPTFAFSYGYRRLSLLSAFFTSLFLIAGSVYILIEAIPRLTNPVQPKVEGMIVFALLGMSVNGYAAWRVHKGSTLNERLVSWHLIEDTLGWVAVFIGSLIMLFVDAPIIDPILSILFTLFILFNVGRSTIATVKLFLQGVPANIDVQKLTADIQALPNVTSCHDVHLWSLDGESHVLTLHVVVDQGTTLTASEILKNSIRALAKQYGKIHATIEVELAGQNCPDVNCTPV